MKKLISALLAILLVTGSVPVQALAVPAPAIEAGPEAAAEPAEKTPVSLRAAGEWLTVPGIEGGQIQFNSDTGTITDCESSVTVANIPDMINGVAVTGIGYQAFQYCNKLASIAIPDSVTGIRGKAFLGCNSLKDITIPDGVTSIADSVFEVCVGLTNITIPDSVTSIGEYAFSDCRSLTGITIPDGVTSIGAHAFNRCSSLMSITIGNCVAAIGAYAFSDCGSLTSITIPDSVTSIGNGAFEDCTKLNSATLGNGVTSIGWGMFEGCSSLTGITIPGSVKEIQGNAFLNCSSLGSVTILDSVALIADCAFDNCSSLRSVTIPNSVTKLGNQAFRNCSSLTDIYVESGNQAYASKDGALFNKDFTSLLTYPGGKSGEYRIPASVTGIGECAFWSCSGLTGIAIPDSVTSIGRYAFNGCSSLSSITIPDSVISIGDHAFYLCDSLTGIAIPGSVTSIGTSVFGSCRGLRSVVLPSSITSIGWGMFEGCSSLVSVTIPDSVTDIGRYAFNRCSSLASVTIPASVTSIGESAFYSCGKLSDVYYGGSPEQWEKVTIASENTPLKNAAIHYSSTAEDMQADQRKKSIPKGSYVFRVADSAGKPVSGASVTLDGNPMSTDARGEATFSSFTAGNPMVTVSKAGYQTWTNENSNWQKSKNRYETIVLYSEAEGSYKLQEALYSNTANFSDLTANLLISTKRLALKNTGNLIGDLDFGNFYLSCKSYSPSETEKYQLWQGETMVAESASGQFSLSVEQFTKGGDCKVQVVAKSGTKVDTSINLEFVENRVNKNTSLKLGKGLSIQVGDTVPFLGGSEIKVNFPELPIDAEVTPSKLHLGFNVNVFDSGDGKSEKEKETRWENMKKSFAKAKRMVGQKISKENADALKKLIKEDKDFGLPATGKVKVNVAGYAEADWGGSTAKGELYVLVSASTRTFGFNTVVVVVPVTVQVKATASVQAGAEIAYNWETNTLTGGLDLNVSVGLNAFGGIGAGSVVGVGVYGDARVKMDSRLFGANPGVEKVDLTGELGLKAYIAFLTYEKAFAHHTWNLYTANHVKAAMLNAAMEAEPDGGGSLFNAASYKPQDLSYLKEESRWLGNAVTLQDASAATALTPLLTDTYRNAQPKMISTGSGLYAAFLRADEATGEVYAAVTKYSGGSWKAPVRADNAAVLDNAPALCEDGSGNIWLAYAKTAPDYDKNSLSDYAKKQSIVVGKIDPSTLVFTKMQEYPGAGYAHLQTLAIVNDMPTLAWVDSAVANDDSVLWPQNNRLYTARYFGGSWGDPKLIATQARRIGQLSLGERYGALAIGCTVDRDNNAATTEDQDLYCYENGRARLLEQGISGVVKFAKLPGEYDADFLWNEADTIQCISGAVAPVEGITGEYAITENRIYYSAAGETGAQLTAVCYENGAWSAPVTITGGERYLENLSAAAWNGNDFVLGMDTLPDITADEVEDAKNLVWARVMPVSDLLIDGIDYDRDSMASGEAVPVKVTVTNRGDHAAGGVSLAVNGGTPVESGALAPGESRELTVDVACPDILTEYSFTVTETGAALEEDYTPDNNTAAVSIGHGNLSVELFYEQIGEARDLVAVVENTGISPASGRVTFYDEQGAAFGETPLHDIAAGEAVLVRFPVPEGFGSRFGGDVAARVEANGEELYGYDNTATLHIGEVLSAAINRVTDLSTVVTAEIRYLGNPGAGTAFCAFYNEAGKMVAIQQQSLKSEITSYHFEKAGDAVRAKVFVLTKDVTPLCEAREISLQ